MVVKIRRILSDIRLAVLLDCNHPIGLYSRPLLEYYLSNRIFEVKKIREIENL